jgi:hypothetical protein
MKGSKNFPPALRVQLCDEIDRRCFFIISAPSGDCPIAAPGNRRLR